MSDKDQNFELHKLGLQQQFDAGKTLDQIEFEREKLERAKILEASKEYARQVHDYSMQYEKHLKEYGQLALRTIFLLNGGAIVALLTFIGGTLGKSSGAITLAPALFVPAFTKYALGLICTALSMLFAYVNYMFHHRTTAGPGDLANNMMKLQEQWPGNYTNANSRGTGISFWLALLLGSGALGFFAWGCFQVANVLSSLKIELPVLV
ncbi:hypothetical protein DC522_01385 [Microvirga sp. KLBC 81]|uniref:hypothetical protein n=1 Tax=Microvirga sp. KLBC 81 TaxID=1862707 RepID=UPI000D509318|nr:hypothetical protein [Microvirga sp. KLBC 81]PVE26444.1 hypothetical protein DC522_01385 [Microvirga sp. KLBC 81]